MAARATAASVSRASTAGGGAAAAAYVAGAAGAATGRTPLKEAEVEEAEEVDDFASPSSQTFARGAACTPTAAPSAATSAAERSLFNNCPLPLVRTGAGGRSRDTEEGFAVARRRSSSLVRLKDAEAARRRGLCLRRCCGRKPARVLLLAAEVEQQQQQEELGSSGSRFIFFLEDRQSESDFLKEGKKEIKSEPTQFFSASPRRGESATSRSLRLSLFALFFLPSCSLFAPLLLSEDEKTTRKRVT